MPYVSSVPKSGQYVGRNNDLEIPPIPPKLAAEFKGYRKSEGSFVPTSWAPTKSDALFDLAFDFISSHETAGPWAEAKQLYGEDYEGEGYDEDDVVTFGREWSYALMDSIGEPYQRNPHGRASNVSALKRSLLG